MAILARRSGPKRRLLSDMNMVPYIDVMLVLVVILMVSAPFVTPALVDLPTVGKSARAPERPLELVVRANGDLVLRDGARELAANLEGAIHVIRQRQAASSPSPTPVVIAADREVRYEHVMQAMDALQREGVQRVGLLVQPAR
jgi:biopolymer transport protein TolR